MAKKPVKDNFALYTVVTVFLIVMAGLGGAWFYKGTFSGVTAKVSYIEFAPLTINLEGYTIAAHLAVQTSPEDADWAEEHKRNLSNVLQRALTDSDPKKMMTPSDLKELQNALKDAGNQALHTAKVQDVLLTDFLIKAD